MTQLGRGRRGSADVSESSPLGPANEFGTRWFRTQSNHFVRFAASAKDKVDLTNATRS